MRTALLAKFGELIRNKTVEISRWNLWNFERNRPWNGIEN